MILEENMDAIPESLIGTLFMDLRFENSLQTYIVIELSERIIMFEYIKRNTMEIFRK
jgi:hypothetical protein